MKSLKRIAFAAMLSLMMCLQNIYVFADSTGDPNIESGGSGMGGGSSGYFWNPTDDGVRVTIVDAANGRKISSSIDYTNKHPDNIQFHFGKVSKSEYTAGISLTLTTGAYRYKNPAQPLPVIVSDGEYWFSNIDVIRSYFTDEQVVESIAGHTGIEFSKLVNGDYKLMIEPLAYVTYNGVRYAMTATEMALYNIQTNGNVRRYLVDLSHQNLPLAMFLEKNDLGYTAWTGSTTARVTDSDIIRYLGVGIVTFKENEQETELGGGEYDYRVDTDVYTAVTVSGGKHTPDNPVTVVFTIKNKRYTVSNVVYPRGESQLVWVKWHTPNTEQTVNIKVTVRGGATADKTNITANILDLDKNPPPNPTAYDRNNSFTAVSIPQLSQKTSLSWSVWSAEWEEDWVWESDWRLHVSVNGSYWRDHGEWVDEGDWEFDCDFYRASITATMDIVPDEKNPTAVGTTMKSGYGINETVTSSVTGNGEHTAVQNAVTYFPEFKYKTYWRMLESTSRGKFEFQRNEYSTYNRRTHFTPLWYPDGNYKVHTWVLDCWTPAGMLSLNKTDSVTIRGNVYDDWHIGPA